MWFLWGFGGAFVGGIAAFVGGCMYAGNHLPEDPTGGDEFVAMGGAIGVGLCGVFIGMLLGLCVLCWRRLYWKKLKLRDFTQSPVYLEDNETIWPPPPNGS